MTGYIMALLTIQLLSLSLITGQIQCLEQTFERYIRFGLGKSYTENSTIRSPETEFSECFKLCYEATECVSLLYQNGTCRLLSSYLQFGLDEGFYFAKTLLLGVGDGKSINSSSMFMEPTRDCEANPTEVKGRLNETDECEREISLDPEDPWWSVDLEKVYKIVRVTWMGKNNSVNQTNIEILVGDTQGDITTPCGFYQGPPTKTDWIHVFCYPIIIGRYVMLRTTAIHMDVGQVSIAALE